MKLWKALNGLNVFVMPMVQLFIIDVEFSGLITRNYSSCVNLSFLLLRTVITL
jgi:hypothetical protein